MIEPELKKEFKRIRRNQHRLSVLVVLTWLMILAVFFIPHVSAVNITMSNPSGIAERDFVVYDSTGTMVGFYNSTSKFELTSAGDYVIMMKPMRTNPLEDPTDWLNNEALPFYQSNVIGVTLLLFCVGLVVGRVI